ncbi:hypothetical protein ACFW5I_38015, partial [Streptomyces sp. NPDC058818]|uniref:hypothetical protein n=1 Tax=Streptomyces sp. NPDC058818 TaxID=3346640 RepID=UPI0036C8F84E
GYPSAARWEANEFASRIRNPLRVFWKGAARLSVIHALREFGFPLRSNPRELVSLRSTSPGRPLRSRPTGYAGQQ